MVQKKIQSTSVNYNTSQMEVHVALLCYSSQTAFYMNIHLFLVTLVHGICQQRLFIFAYLMLLIMALIEDVAKARKQTLKRQSQIPMCKAAYFNCTYQPCKEPTFTALACLEAYIVLPMMNAFQLTSYCIAK